MQKLKQKIKSDEFHTGDIVKINAMFFRNHGLKLQDIQGTVKGVVPIWESKIPAVSVSFKFDPTFNQWSQNGYIKYNLFKDNGQFVALIRIHPMYLEHVK